MTTIEISHRFSLDDHSLAFESGGKLLVSCQGTTVQTFDCTSEAVGLGIENGDIVIGTVTFSVLSPKSFVGNIQSFVVEENGTGNRTSGFGIIDIRDNTKTIQLDLDHEPVTIQSSTNSPLSTILVRPIEDATPGESPWYQVTDVDN